MFFLFQEKEKLFKTLRSLLIPEHFLCNAGKEEKMGRIG